MAVQRQYINIPQKWYFSRQEIEEHSPSRKDGIDLQVETFLRKLYCSFLQELGMELKVPQQTIATAIMFCHRFYLRQSHAKNDWQTIASVCMFLASKVEETPRRINNFVVEVYKKIFNWDPCAPQRIKDKEVFDQQKNLILIGERMLLATIAYDMNLEHPYKPLVAALKNLNISNREVSKVAWNYVNDCLRTTLCLQYKPRYVAAGSLFLAANLLGVKLPIQKGKAWWLQFDISSKLLEEVVLEMVTLLNEYKQLVPSSRTVIQSKVASPNRASYSPNSCTINGTPVDQKHVMKMANTACLPDRTSQESNSGTTSTVSVAEDDNGEPRDIVESCQKPSCKLVPSRRVAHQIREPIKRQRCEKEVVRVNHWGC